MNAWKELTVIIYSTELTRNCQKFSGAEDDVAYLKQADDTQPIKEKFNLFCCSLLY